MKNMDRSRNKKGKKTERERKMKNVEGKERKREGKKTAKNKEG